MKIGQANSWVGGNGSPFAVREVLMRSAVPGKLVVLLLAGCLCGCSSVSAPGRDSFPIICLETYKGNNVYVIAVQAKAHSKLSARQYLYKRIGEIIRREGYANCEILQTGAEDEQGVVNFVQDAEVVEKIYGKIKCYKE